MAFLDLIRHGEPEGGRRFRGSGVDDPLSEAGWRQMETSIARLIALEHDARAPWDRILSSPLTRCRAFAEELAACHDILLVVDDRLREIGFGDWEGREADEVRCSDAEAWAAFFGDPVNNRPTGAEGLAAFRARVEAALDGLPQADKPTLVVAHAGVLRAAVARVLKMPDETMYRIAVPYAGMVRIGEKAGTPVVRFL